MRKFFFRCAAVAAVLCAAGCEQYKTTLPDFDFQPAEQDRLTGAEHDALLWHARRFAAESKIVKLTPEQRNVIRATVPHAKFKYFAPKYGQVILSWQVAENKMVELSGTGAMTSSRFPWRLEIKITNLSHPVPKHMNRN